MTDKLEIKAIGQIAVAVSDIRCAVEFYREVLGLPLLFEAPPGLAFFDCGGVRLMLTVLQGEQRDHHTSVIYYMVGDIEEAADRLRAQEVVMVREPQLVARMQDHDLWMAFIRDPDENLIGIMSEVPHTAG